MYLAQPDLKQAICARLAIDQSACSWRIDSRAGVGRFLVAARDLAVNEPVFSELPLLVAMPAADTDEQVLRSEMPPSYCASHLTAQQRICCRSLIFQRTRTALSPAASVRGRWTCCEPSDCDHSRWWETTAPQ